MHLSIRHRMPLLAVHCKEEYFLDMHYAETCPTEADCERVNRIEADQDTQIAAFVRSC
jgi:hypothetical protein